MIKFTFNFVYCAFCLFYFGKWITTKYTSMNEEKEQKCTKRTVTRNVSILFYAGWQPALHWSAAPFCDKAKTDRIGNYLTYTILLYVYYKHKINISILIDFFFFFNFNTCLHRHPCLEYLYSFLVSSSWFVKLLWWFHDLPWALCANFWASHSQNKFKLDLFQWVYLGHILVCVWNWRCSI